MAAAYPPTPPFSPQSLPLPGHNELRSTINLLDSLIAHYHRERMWVYRTRADLENALLDPPAYTTTSQPQSPPADDDDYSDSPPPRDKHLTSAQFPLNSRWIKRKKGFKLRLEISPTPKRVALQLPPLSQKSSDPLPPREQILEMFDKMIESRIESCERVNKLIRSANRAHLRNR